VNALQMKNPKVTPAAAAMQVTITHVIAASTPNC
jgi:hypothetical protein